MTDSDAARPGIWNRTNIVALTILVVSTVWLIMWFVERERFVYVTDARVSTDMISIASKTPGLITGINVSEGSSVESGDVLVTLDDRDIQLKLRAIEAELATVTAELARQENEILLTERRVESTINAERAARQAARSALAEADVRVEQAGHDLKRADRLLADKLISDEEWEQRKVAFDTYKQVQQRRVAEVASAEADLVRAEADEAEIDVLRSGLDIIRRRGDALRIEQQRLNEVLADHRITTPIRGVIDEGFSNPGEYVYPGQRILMLHDPETLWVKANIKETEIRHVNVGALVDITVDAWPDLEFSGQVARVGAAATSQFALLPSPNPSGNFTKTTQRLEVKVSIDDHRGLLKPGMMVELKVDKAT